MSRADGADSSSLRDGAARSSDRDYKRMGLLKERVELEQRTTLEDIVVGSADGAMKRQRLGGLLNYYCRAA